MQPHAEIAALREPLPVWAAAALAVGAPEFVPAALWALLPRHAGFSFLDLGCGTGSLLTDFARARPDGSYHGIETAPFSFLLSCWRARSASVVSVAGDDFWRADFAQHDMVYAYLSVSNTFAIPGVEPTPILPVGDRLNSTLFVWRM